MKLIHYGATSFDEAKFRSIKNREYCNKPLGGLWTSPVNSKYSWKDWNEAENFIKYEESNCFTIDIDD